MHKKNLLEKFLYLASTTLLALACGGGGGGSDGPSSTPVQETQTTISASKISDMSVSKDTDFVTTKEKSYNIPVNEVQLAGTKYFLKMSFNSDLKDHFFLGEINKSKPYTINIISPKACKIVYYEIYSNQGQTLQSNLIL